MADLLSLDDAEYKLADLDGMKNHSKEMLMIFETHLTSYDPAVVDPDEWDYKTFCVWDDLDTSIERMINRHGVAMGTDAINEWKQISMESEQKYLDNYAVTKEVYKVFTAQVKTAEVDIAFEIEIEESKEVDLIVFDEEKCFDKGKEEVKGIFEDNGTLLDTPIDESVFSSELLKSPDIADELDEVPKVRADHYEALTGEDAHSEALAGEQDDHEALTEKFAVSETRILFGNDGIKDGQQFVNTEGFKEDNLGSKVQYNTRTLMLDVPDPSTHSMASHINNQVGKLASYETCYRLKDKALCGLVKVIGLDDSYYMHAMAKVVKVLTALRREVPRKVEPDKLLLTCFDMIMTLKTSFSQHEEVERCVNKTGWLLQVRAVQWCIAWT